MSSPIDDLARDRGITSHAAGMYASGKTTSEVMIDLQGRYPGVSLVDLVNLASIGQAIAGERSTAPHTVPVEQPGAWTLDTIEGQRPKWVEIDVEITKSDGTTETKGIRVTVRDDASWDSIMAELDGVIADIGEGYGYENVSSGSAILIY